jgi:aminoglycoside/choline kinase family phosphotransferase
MWLSHNSGINKVGILDFQDAALGFPTYDLVSLLEDARRDLKPATVSLCKEKFFASFSHIYRDNLEDAYAILGLQRNLRIIGVFHRLNLSYGKIKYTTYLPRVWNYVKQNLNYPLLKPIQEIIHKYNLYEF